MKIEPTKMIKVFKPSHKPNEFGKVIVMKGYFCGCTYEEDTKALNAYYYIPDFGRGYEATDEQEAYLEKTLGDEYWTLPWGTVKLGCTYGGQPDPDEWKWNNEEE